MIYILLTLFTLVNSYGWVPLIDVKNYPINKPREIELMNKKLVIWEKNKNIIVQDNACIHRGGPLSEGYIDPKTQNLRCSYHGWEFDTNGKVLDIPQALDKCKTCKFQQKTYELKECNHIIWINLNNTFNNDFPKHITEYHNRVSDDVFMVEVPYSMNILLENLFDPAHVPFAHHKLQSTRDLASSVNASVLTMNENSLEIYFEDNTLRNAEYRNGTMSFYEPCHYVLSSIYPEVFIKRLHVYCVPITPFKTRIFVQNEYKDKQMQNFTNKIPSWIKHLLTHTFFDSDTMLLYKQEQMLRSKNKLNDCIKTYTTPTTSDNSIQYYHKWKKMYSKPWSNFIEKSANQTNVLRREEVFDRYHDHTKHCISCSKTLKTIRFIQNLIPSLLLIHSIRNNNIIESSLSIVIFFICDNLKSFFIFRDYKHNKI